MQPAAGGSVSSTWMQSTNRPRTSTISGSSRTGPKFYQNICGMNPNDLYNIDFDNINSKYNPFYDKYQNDAAVLNHVMILYCPKHAVLTEQKELLVENVWKNKLATLILIVIGVLTGVLGIVHSVVWAFITIFCLLFAIYNIVVLRRKTNNAKLIRDDKCHSYFCYDIVDRSIKFVIYDKNNGKPVDVSEHQIFCQLGDFLSINYIEASHGYESMVEIRCRRNFVGSLSPSLNNIGAGAGKAGAEAEEKNGIDNAGGQSSTDNGISIVSVHVNHTLGINKMEFENIMQERIDIIRKMGVKLLDETYQALSGQ